MDQHQQPNIHDDQSQNFVPSQYAMYPASEDDPGYLVYPPQMPGYQGVVQQHPGPPPRQLSESDLHQAMQYHRSIHMMPAPGHGQHFAPPAPVYTASPPHGVMPLSASPPPQSPNMYDPLSPPISGSDTSADGIYHSRNSSATGSPLLLSSRSASALMPSSAPLSLFWMYTTDGLRVMIDVSSLSLSSLPAECSRLSPLFARNTAAATLPCVPATIPSLPP
ncbi:hypothetical protein NUW54_g14470 [Trametes sanguinea]|uniref:Uncharacterized protein n=1 Tax=Trametes sanguinea TaxID=158606 RepID=A0ACC1MDY3_9APHY|nr:hypothetical protein NUW54_g14470 [Trametes sanguinea]